LSFRLGQAHSASAPSLFTRYAGSLASRAVQRCTPWPAPCSTPSVPAAATAACRVCLAAAMSQVALMANDWPVLDGWFSGENEGTKTTLPLESVVVRKSS
jgi:hypothetical protein